MSRKRALIAEDSLLIMVALETMLEDAGIEIAGAAGNLSEALTLAPACDADVAILDINLGDAMIFPAADILAARGIPIVFTTGYAPERTLLTRYPQARMIQKPYEAAALLKLVAQSLQATAQPR